MRTIVIFGAGKSAYVLLDYLVKQAVEEAWKIIVLDVQVSHVLERFKDNPALTAFPLDASNDIARQEWITKADIIVSMLPAKMHAAVAKDCIKFQKNLITPSYISPEMKAMEAEVKQAGLLFLNEMGLDPGIDHMSAMYIIDHLKSTGAEITAFESFCGGLVAPESDDNPWNYKFTWNPRNVVLAGQGDGGIKFIHNGHYKYIPYHKLFKRTEIITIDGHGMFEGYANRDSLKYREEYGLENVQTMYRGTLRKPGFCSAWDIFVQLGMTDDSYFMEDTETMTYRQFTNTFLKYRQYDTVELKLAYYVGIDVDSVEMEKIKWLGLFDNHQIIGLKKASPAQVLQHILEKKLSMHTSDKDMIVMWHKFNYTTKTGEEKELHSHLVVKGKTQYETAMSTTVGLPIGIALKNILNKKITEKGILLPTKKTIYEPILRELEDFGIQFIEKEIK